MVPALLTAVNSTAHVHLIVGSNPLVVSRCARSLDVGARPILIAPAIAALHPGLAKRIEQHEVQWLHRDFCDEDLTTLGREEVDCVVDAVFITSGARTAQAAQISARCRRLRIPVNITDSTSLSTFTLLSTHTSGPLQIGVTTSGKGCKLASRIRREVVSSLPQDLGVAVERIGQIRKRIWEQDHAIEGAIAPDADGEDEDTGQSAEFNKLVNAADAEAARARRMRWLAQICEYWPLRRLAAITDDDMDAMLTAYKLESVESTGSESNGIPLCPSKVGPQTRLGHIVLAGAGPGHPDLLTTATQKAIRSADVILADKLVPAPVLDLVPRRTPIHIARKFPGNADAAQEELHQLGLTALQAGQTVVRLKQGDPYLYGRGAEEVAFFRKHGYEATVLPGVTSALSAPLFAGLPVTHRAVADQVLVCTGTGRAGKAPPPPAFLSNQTVVFLMALHRLGDLVRSLTTDSAGVPIPWPLDTPCAVVERASCPDQRVIRTSLRFVEAAIDEEGSRPPGLLVVGAACEVLHESTTRWIVEDGFKGLDFLDHLDPGVPCLQQIEHDNVSSWYS